MGTNQDRAPSSSIIRLLSRVELVAMIWTLAVYLGTFVVVREYYVRHLPHYDSIGSYGRLFELLNLVHQGGFWAAVRQASHSSITWLQPAFALMLAWAPVRAPEWLVSLNFVLLVFAQLSILAYCRTCGFGKARQLVAVALPVIPGALYAWDGGLQDLRRDPQLTILLLGCFFLALAYSVSPSVVRGGTLGILFALAQWSRDNAATMMLIVAAPAAVVIVRQYWPLSRWRGLLRLVAPPAATFAIVAGPYYWFTVEATVNRYMTNIWGVGEDRLQSFLAFWYLPAGILFGYDSRIGVELAVGVATGLLLAGLGLFVVALARYGFLRLSPAALRAQPAMLPLMGGTWVIVAVVLYNTVLLGYGARWYAVPFQPVVVGLVAVLFGLTGLIQRGPGVSDRAAILVAAIVCAIVAVSVPIRMQLNTASVGSDQLVDTVRAAAIEIADITRGRSVAFLWSQGFGRHHVRYYVAQTGRSPIIEFEALAYVNGDPIDLDQPLRASDRPNELRRQLDRTIRRYADFVLVCTETGYYQDRSSVLWPYQLGRPVVRQLLDDPGFQPVASFTLIGRPFVLLENRTRQ